MPSIRSMFISAGSAAALVFSASAFSQPDLTGVWTTYNGPAAIRQNRSELPYTDYGREQRQDYLALVEGTGVTPYGMCLGLGMPASVLGTSGFYPMQWVQHDDVIMQVYEAMSEIRRIYIGEDVFPQEDLFPDRNGYSEGQWQGDELVVKTTQLLETGDQNYAHSEEAVITERYKRSVDAEGTTVLTLELTLVDPVYYTEPVTVIKQWAKEEGGRLLPYECNEVHWYEFLNERREILESGN